ncbi:MAG: hypothetical protein MUQ00_05905, partial [Candidatus Aminicenantes bacterium]|nr:hypothetical protein [Candidatus Aminicenantes bacterium]
MDREKALELIQHMHETGTVSNDTIISWYRFYAHKLPKMHPERSDVDLIRTVALWMRLTDRGGSPGYPYQYKSALNFRSIRPTMPADPDRSWLIGVLVSVVGLIVLFLNWKVGLALALGGQVIHYIGYRLAGGPTNPNLMKEGTTLYEREGRRVIEWATRQS